MSAGGGRGGGRRSDVMLKHDITLLGYLRNGIGFYRFSYHGSDKAYVGVIAQEVETVMPEAVIRGRDGYLLVLYDRLGLRLQTYDRWMASGARMPAVSPNRAGVSDNVLRRDWQQRVTYPGSRTVPPPRASLTGHSQTP
jgi:Chaperone of endosialidase